MPTPRAARTPDRRPIDAVIDERRVRAVYQPLVHLDSGEVVGFEALARGEAGTPLESPLDLLSAAQAAGRLPELDWLCRAATARGVLATPVDPALALFVNTEPRTAGYPCPPDLADDLAAVARRLPIVVEVTERSLARHPAALLDAVAEYRRRGYRVALDDVGAEPASLALLPFVHPDVVKLDLGLVRGRPGPAAAVVANAVRAYAEASGAVVLAEGIETPAQVEVARVLGASCGQGWLFGRPGPLPTAVPSPRHPLPLLTPAALDRRATPFELVAAARGVARTTKSLLLPMSRHLENQALAGGEAVVLLGCFQHARHVTPATAERYSRLARVTAFTAALAVDLADGSVPGVRAVPLAGGDRLVREWNVLVVGPHFAGALAAREVDGGDPARDGDRRFDYAITHDRPLVLAAARAALGWVVAPGG